MDAPRVTDKKVSSPRRRSRVKRMTPDEIREAARAMVNAKDPAEADRLEEQLVRGFCGGDDE